MIQHTSTHNIGRHLFLKTLIIIVSSFDYFSGNNTQILFDRFKFFFNLI